MTDISYAGNDLQTANIIVSSIDHESLPTIDAKMYALSHTSKSVIPYQSYPSKTIVISGTIYGSSAADLESRADAFRGFFVGTDQNLDIAYNNSTRRYIATPNVVKIERPGGLTWGTFSVTFTCTQPFGQDTSTQTVVNASGRTSSSYNDTYTFLGTAPEQKLVTITITLNSVTNVGGGHIVIGNNATGEQLTVQRSWSNGDVLVIDCANKVVTVNGTEVDFSGAFPLFAAGSQTLTYLDNFSARNFDIDAVYYPLYL